MTEFHSWPSTSSLSGRGETLRKALLEYGGSSKVPPDRDIAEMAEVVDLANQIRRIKLDLYFEHCVFKALSVDHTFGFLTKERLMAALDAETQPEDFAKIVSPVTAVLQRQARTLECLVPAADAYVRRLDDVLDSPRQSSKDVPLPELLFELERAEGSPRAIASTLLEEWAKEIPFDDSGQSVGIFADASAALNAQDSSLRMALRKAVDRSNGIFSRGGIAADVTAAVRKPAEQLEALREEARVSRILARLALQVVELTDRLDERVALVASKEASWLRYTELPDSKPFLEQFRMSAEGDYTLKYSERLAEHLHLGVRPLKEYGGVATELKSLFAHYPRLRNIKSSDVEAMTLAFPLSHCLLFRKEAAFDAWFSVREALEPFRHDELADALSAVAWGPDLEPFHERFSALRSGLQRKIEAAAEGSEEQKFWAEVEDAAEFADSKCVAYGDAAFALKGPGRKWNECIALAPASFMRGCGRDLDFTVTSHAGDNFIHNVVAEAETLERGASLHVL